MNLPYRADDVCLCNPRLCWTGGLHHKNLSTAVTYMLWAASSRYLSSGLEQPTWAFQSRVEGLLNHSL